MEITCPHCEARYKADIPALPAKVLCTTCGAKCLIDQQGFISILETKQAVAAPAVRRATTVTAAKPSKGNGATMSVVAVLLVIGAGLYFILKEKDRKDVPEIVASETSAMSSVPEEEEPSSETPPPEVMVPAPDSPPITDAPQVTAVEEKEIAPVTKATRTLEEASPEIFLALTRMDERIAVEPSSAEEEVGNFIRGLFAKREGGTIGAGLTTEHPVLMMALLGDLWKRIEDSPGAKLPETQPLMIGTMRSRAQDLTESYVALLGRAASGGPVDDDGLEKLSKEERVGKLLGHFANGQDSSTPENALTFGRMIHDIRRGKTPLEEAEAAKLARSIDDLPKLPGSVDLGGFESVQELVKWAHSVNPTSETPVELSAGEAAERMAMRAKAYLNLPTKVLLPHPSAVDFPGPVPAKAPRVERELTIDTAVAAWHPTGLYAAPGEVITVRVPSALRGKDFRVIIGSQKGDNTEQIDEEEPRKLTRFPIIMVSGKLDETRVEIGNPFGGPIFIDVPYRRTDGVLSITAHGEIVRCYPKQPEPVPETVTIAGGVEMPWWRPGMTNEDFKKEMQKPAPWVELDFGMLRMAVPAKEAKEMIKDAEALRGFWVTAMDAQWKFGGFPGVRVIPMRTGWDRQLSFGFMHSGYPIGAPVAYVKDGIDLQRLREKGTWGIFHETGHNHQPVHITPEGFVESTVNLFTLAAHIATHPGENPYLAHSGLSDPDGMLKRRMAGESDPFVNLSLFIPLIEEFGMESLTETFKIYWKEDVVDGSAKSLPTLEREDLWARRFGDTVKRDVGPYFEKVGYRLTPATKSQLAKYDEWNPKRLK